jgi:DNA-binding CsgD family transcriptional regulator
VNEIEDLSRLIGDFYDASLDPMLWPDAFHKAAKYIGGSASYLFWQDILGESSDGYFAAGHDPHFLQLYYKKYFKINPVFPTVVFHDLEQALSIPDCLPQEDFCRSQFVREWVVPQGYVDVAFSNVEKSATSCAVFTVMRHISDGFGDDNFRRRFALVVPHVRRALLIGKVINLHKVEAAALADSLDTLASAMFLVDGAGRIVHANASGYAMISETRALRAPNGRLGAIDPVADRAFSGIFAAAEGGDISLGKRGISVPLLARDNERYVAHVLPLTSGARRQAGVSYGAVAAVFVRKAALDFPLPPVAIAQQFKLTQAELRVLFSVMEFTGITEIAEVLGISEATAKTHLHHVFEKTGTGRQADLVKLVAGYCLVP